MVKTNSVRVAQYDKDGELLAKYASLTEAAYWTETQIAHIGKVCNGKRKFAGGFVWKSDTAAMSALTNSTNGIRQTDLAGNIVAVYATTEIASTMTEISSKRIATAVKNARKMEGYHWS